MTSTLMDSKFLVKNEMTLQNTEVNELEHYPYSSAVTSNSHIRNKTAKGQSFSSSSSNSSSSDNESPVISVQLSTPTLSSVAPDADHKVSLLEPRLKKTNESGFDVDTEGYIDVADTQMFVDTSPEVESHENRNDSNVLNEKNSNLSEMSPNVESTRNVTIDYSKQKIENVEDKDYQNSIDNSNCDSKSDKSVNNNQNIAIVDSLPVLKTSDKINTTMQYDLKSEITKDQSLSSNSNSSSSDNESPVISVQSSTPTLSSVAPDADHEVSLLEPRLKKTNESGFDVDTEGYIDVADTQMFVDTSPEVESHENRNDSNVLNEKNSNLSEMSPNVESTRNVTIDYSKQKIENVEDKDYQNSIDNSNCDSKSDKSVNNNQNIAIVDSLPVLKTSDKINTTMQYDLKSEITKDQSLSSNSNSSSSDNESPIISVQSSTPTLSSVAPDADHDVSLLQPEYKKISESNSKFDNETTRSIEIEFDKDKKIDFQQETLPLELEKVVFYENNRDEDSSFQTTLLKHHSFSSVEDNMNTGTNISFTCISKLLCVCCDFGYLLKSANTLILFSFAYQFHAPLCIYMHLLCFLN